MMQLSADGSPVALCGQHSATGPQPSLRALPCIVNPYAAERWACLRGDALQ